MSTIEIVTKKDVELVDITDSVEKFVQGVKDGVCIVYTRHTTGALFINENENGLKQDILGLLEKLVPKDAGYHHDKIDNNAHAHLRATLLSPSVSIPVENGKLVLGTWQRVFFAEFDGPRRRRVIVKVIGE
jgi:secondary thiamine-phosphate synthase enzyme